MRNHKVMNGESVILEQQTASASLEIPMSPLIIPSHRKHKEAFKQCEFSYTVATHSRFLV